MTADPYQTPQSPLEANRQPGHYGRIDIGRAFSEGWELMKGNLFPMFGMGVVFALLSGVSMALLALPALIVVPALSWGFTAWMLDAYEGKGSFGQLFDGFSSLGSALLGFLLYFLALVLIGLPAQAISLAGELAELPLLSLAATLVSILTSLITVRWSFTGFFIVEHKMNGFDAVRASWNATKGQWLTVFLLGLASFVVCMIGLAALVVGIIPATVVATFAFVSAYRQLVGPAPASR